MTLDARLTATTASLLELQTLYDTLEQERADLEQDLTAANILLASAQANVASLQDSNNQLLDQLAAASASLTELQQENDELRASLADAEARYNSLYQQYLVLEAAKQFAVDSRLSVALSTEIQPDGTIQIRCQVTNTSGQTIAKAYLLVAHFAADGTLNSIDLRPVLNIGPGQSKEIYVITTTGETVRITALSDD